MKKIFKSFTFWFIIISFLIILINLTGNDEKNILLIGLNPILAFNVYFKNLIGVIENNEPNFNTYIIHLITFIIYGGLIDIVIHGFNYIIKNLRMLKK